MNRIPAPPPPRRRVPGGRTEASSSSRGRRPPDNLKTAASRSPPASGLDGGQVYLLIDMNTGMTAAAKHRFVRNHLSDYCCSPSRSFVCNTALTGGLSRFPVRLSVLTTSMFEQRRARAAEAEAAAVLPPPPLLQHLQVQRKPPPFCCRNPNITLEIPNGTLRPAQDFPQKRFCLVWRNFLS